MRWKKRSRATPVRRWRWLRSLTRCGSNSFVTTRPIRCGQTATALSCLQATRPCCFTRLLHLAGVRRIERHRITDDPAVSLDDIKNFRQLDSVTPGHPEYGRTSGVETTTGPLGQGCGNSVGMAIASRWLGARYNRPDSTLFDFDVYTICSDGDMMEGVASEAASLAGHLQLANLCWIYDSNTVTIEGHTDLAFSEDVASTIQSLPLERFAAAGCQRHGWFRTRGRDISSHRGSPHPHHRRQHHRLWRTA